MKKQGKTKNNRILVIGDLHWKPYLSYSEYIPERREREKKEVLNLIVEQAKDCTKVVFLGDNLHSRSNSSQVIKEFTNFVERFNDKEVFILKGNHEAFGNGLSAIDYLKEVKNKNWHIITNEVEVYDDLVFCPFFTKSELGSTDNEDSSKKIVAKLKDGSILFIHHAISGALTGSAYAVENFPEPILPREKLEKKYNLVVGGHIHNPQVKNKTIVAGSIFTSEVGEEEKFVWKINPVTLDYEKIRLPVRPIIKLENPDSLPSDPYCIVKVVLTKKMEAAKVQELKKALAEKVDAYILVEKIPREREKAHYGEGENLLEMSVEQLLKIYSETKKVDLEKLLRGWELIKQ